MSIIVIALGWWLIATGIAATCYSIVARAVALNHAGNWDIMWWHLFTSLSVPVAPILPGVALVLWGGAL